ncbi:peptidylprolyl isomerase [Candidatus Pelagibacter sp.]|nr:peptidylprolyl isomerase [Candidatus Pelagibacter sp.]
MSKAKINKFIIRQIYKIFFISALMLIFMVNGNIKALENKILIKLNNEIITTVDISNEISYLKAFNKSIKELDNQKIISIAKNSIIKDRIKKIEIQKLTDNITIDQEYLKSMIKNAYLNIGLMNIDEFKNHLKYNDVNIEMVEEKLILDAYWKQIIFEKYKNKIKIDEKKIIDEITKRKNKFYNISEIVFNVEKNEKLNEKFNLIKQSINKNGFENTALIYGISETSKNGGNLGWINQSALSPKIENKLSFLNLGEVTEPITIPGGFLILKVNNIKNEQIEIDIDKEVKKVIDIKLNEQLNQFSTLYINKVKKNIIINEL